LALKDENDAVRDAAAEALGGINDKSVVDHLIIALRDKAWRVRSTAATALDKLNWNPKDDSEKAQYLMAKKEWRDLSSLGKPAITPLMEALNDTNIGVRKNAVEALGLMRVEGATALLQEMSKNKDADVRKYAKRALHRIRMDE
jgi:HEAT repeat protein